MELLRVTVPPEASPTTVGRYLQGPLELSSTLVRRLKMAAGIRLNGEVVRTNHPLAPGDELVLSLPPAPAEGVMPEPVPLDVVYEDDDLIVLNKAAGVVVHPTKGVYHGTLANGLAFYFHERGTPFGIHPVHRIDRDTTGLVLFAKHPLAHLRLDRQLQAHKLERRYVALVWGRPEADAGRIEEAIGLVAGHPVAREVAEGGQPAATRFEVRARFDTPAPWGSSLLALTLETGRTHQIRVHMAHRGHPLLGDTLYAGDRPAVIDRQALHAATLTFRHPRSGERLSFEAPLPHDMEAVIALAES